jgi:hypothetical protein
MLSTVTNLFFSHLEVRVYNGTGDVHQLLSASQIMTATTQVANLGKYYGVANLGKYYGVANLGKYYRVANLGNNYDNFI